MRIRTRAATRSRSCTTASSRTSSRCAIVSNSRAINSSRRPISEVIAHLIHAHYKGDLLDAVRNTVAEFKGAYAIAAISTREPGRMVGARAGSPLLVGIGEHDHFLASDASALASVTQRVAYLEEGDVADITRESYAIYDADGRAGDAFDRDGARIERRGRARTLPAFHAEGDLRAAARDRRHARERGRYRPRPVRRGRRRGLGQGQGGALPRVRHELLLGDARATVAGGRGRHSGAGRDRQRISLSRQRPESRCADRGDLAIGRDRGHAGSAQARQVTRSSPHA